VNNSEFKYGEFVNAVVSFVLIGAAVYFLIVRPMNAMQARFRKPEASTTKECPECLSTIPIGARRCAHCTAVLA
jgi:large conductance mechanosensitive channel